MILVGSLRCIIPQVAKLRNFSDILVVAMRKRAKSTGKCKISDLFEEFFFWGRKNESFARAEVQFTTDIADIFVREFIEVVFWGMYCLISLLTFTQGRLAKQFGGERVGNGFSSRFLKVYHDITDMPT